MSNAYLTNLNLFYDDFAKKGTASSSKDINYKELFESATRLSEYITFCDPFALRDFLNYRFNESEDDFFNIPFWIKALTFRLIILQIPNDLETIEWATNHLSWFMSSDMDLIVELKRKAEELKKNK